MTTTWADKLPIPERITNAKRITLRVVDHAMYLLELHENNTIILYSPTLSSQIPTSMAANAFNVFQRGLHQFEIVRLCALWDRSEIVRENIPTVIDLVDDAEIIEALAQECRAHWSGFGGRVLDPSDDPDLHALEIEPLQQANEQFGEQQAQKARDELRKAIIDARAIMESARLGSIMNIRHKHLAHSLSQTSIERKAGTVAPMKYGDERKILDDSLRIIEALYCWINGASFDFEDSRRIDRRNAEALWTRCTFDIVD